jgi:hypothetical protein
MGFFKKAAGILGLAGAMGAVEQGIRPSEAEAHQDKMQTPHVEKMVSPERAFVVAKQAVIDEMNEAGFDETSGGELQGKGWKAKVERSPEGGLIAKVTVEAGGSSTEQTFDIRADDHDDGKGNIKTVFSMNTGIDRDEERLVAEAQATVDAALGKGKKGPTVAMNRE